MKEVDLLWHKTDTELFAKNEFLRYISSPMEYLLNILNLDNFLFGIPALKIIAVTVIITVTLLFRRLFSVLVIKYLKKLAARTSTELDDSLIQVIEKPLGALILLTGLIISRMLLVAHINPSIDRTLQSFLQFCFVMILCWAVYRSAEVSSVILEKIARRTKNELDDLLLPYAKRVIKSIAILIAMVKAAEVFLGMSAASLIGLLGGMGLTLGLVFKDIIANWFGCAVIYIDNLFREGDWVQLDDGKVVDADVESIGIRSTQFRNFDKTVSIVPNAVIATAVVKNWSRMYKRRVKYSFKIDGISSEKLERILSGIREIIHTDEDVHQEFHMVNFRELEGNARIIRLYYFTKTTLWKQHEQVRENINLKIIKLFEKEDIQRLAYTIIDLSEDRPGEFQLKGGRE